VRSSGRKRETVQARAQERFSRFAVAQPVSTLIS
jgi:hypothetical protein